MLTADFVNQGEMAMKQIIESTIAIAASIQNTPFSVTLYDDAGNYLTSTTVDAGFGSGAVWGSNLWGVNNWTSSLTRCVTTLIEWSQPIVYNRLSLQVTCTAAQGTAIDSFTTRSQLLGYTLNNSLL